MPASSAQRARILSRRAKVAHLILTEPGISDYQIAARLGMEPKSAHTTINNDRHAVEEEWKQSTLVEFDVHKGRQYAKLIKAEEELWKAWFRSQEERVATTQTGRRRRGDDGEMEDDSANVSVRKEKRVGDPRYMALILDVVQKQNDLLGLTATLKDGVTSAPPIVGFEIADAPPAPADVSASSVPTDLVVEVADRPAFPEGPAA